MTLHSKSLLTHFQQRMNLRFPLSSACSLVTIGLFAVSAVTGCTTPQNSVSPKLSQQDSQNAIVSIEQKYDAAIGVSLRDAEGKVLLEWRSRERFPLTSTVKALECARVYELGLEKRSAPIKTTPVVPHSPVYGTVNPDTKVTLKEACRAALSQSDNRAANFIFVHTGGPKALTEWLRQKGDNTTQSDRLEPDLNLSGKMNIAIRRRRAMRRSIGDISILSCPNRLAVNGWQILPPIRWPAICFVRVYPKAGRFSTVPEPDRMNSARPAPIMRSWSRTRALAITPPCI